MSFLLTTALLVSAGCQDQSQDPSPAVTPSAPETEQPTHGGSFRMKLPSPLTLDPASISYEHETFVIRQIFDGLVELDAQHRPNPALASYWTVEDDYTRYTFHLRTDVRFHHGRKVTAEDFIYTFERVLVGDRTESTGRDLLLHIKGAREFVNGTAETIKGLTTDGEGVLILQLSHPVANYPSLLADDSLRVVPIEVIESVGDLEFGRRPIGTGPYVFGEWNRSELVLLRNDNYYGSPSYLAEVRIDLTLQPEEDLPHKLSSGEVHFCEINSDQAKRLDQGVTTYTADNAIIYLGFNGAKDQVNDPLIRQAIAHGIDRQRLLDDDSDTLEPVTSLIPRGLFGHSLKSKSPTYDPAKVAQLLSEAGYPEGKGLWPIDLWSPSHTKIEDEIRACLKELDIKCQFKVVHFGRLQRFIAEGRASMFILSFAFHIPDGAQVLRRLFHTDGGYNTFSYSNPAVDELMEKGEQVHNSKERFGYFEEVQKILLEDLPVIPLLKSRVIYGVGEEVHGLSPGPFGLSSLNLEKVWISVD